MSVQIDGSLGVVYPDGSTQTTATPKSTGIVGGVANQVLVQTSVDTTGFIAAPTTPGTFLTWDGLGFDWAPAGGGGGGGVTTFSGGSTGLTPSSAVTGVVTMGGVLNSASGGTGVSNPSGVLYFNAALPASVATGSQLVSAIGATPVSFATTATSASSATNATNVTGGGAINATPIGNITPSTVSATQFIGLSGGSF